MTARGMAGFGAASIGIRRNVFGSARYVPGIRSAIPVFLMDVPNGATLGPNASVDIPFTGAAPTANGTNVGNPIFVALFAAATAGAAVACGTLTASVVQADNTTRPLTQSSHIINGSSPNNFLAWGAGGLTKAGDKAIRITSSGADGTTLNYYRATVWSRLLSVAPVWNTVSQGGGNSPETRTTSAFPVGAAVFMFAAAWSGPSASKSVSWFTPAGSPSTPAPGKDWLVRSFNIAGAGTFPMYCALVPGKGTVSSVGYTITDSSPSDWLDLAWHSDQAQSWGIS